MYVWDPEYPVLVLDIKVELKTNALFSTVGGDGEEASAAVPEDLRSDTVAANPGVSNLAS